MKKVIGLGGVFFKAKDPEALRAWYKKHLGIESEQWGAVFKWDSPETKDRTTDLYNVWSPFPETTAYLSPSEKPFMINYIVADLAELVKALNEEGVTLAGKMEESEFGKFAWVLDPEGNKLELWEPV